MSVGVMFADAVAMAAQHGGYPGPGTVTGKQAVPGGGAGREAAYAIDRVSRRWSGFMVEAALRAAGNAAAQRP